MCSAASDIEAESRADKRATGFWIGIGGENPAFVLMVAEDVHQGFDVELDFGFFEIEEHGCRPAARSRICSLEEVEFEVSKDCA